MRGLFSLVLCVVAFVVAGTALVPMPHSIQVTTSKRLAGLDFGPGQAYRIDYNATLPEAWDGVERLNLLIQDRPVSPATLQAACAAVGFSHVEVTPINL